MAVLDGRHAAADNEDPVGSGLGKIIRALPRQRGPTGRDDARARARRTRSVGRARPGHHERAGRGGGAQRQVRIGYRSAAGHSHSFEVDPWSVVVRYGRWYLLCFAHHADAVRTYRIDRVTAVGEGTRTFETPDGLDPVAVLEENLASGWEYDTRVVFAAPAAEVAPWLRSAMGRLEPLDERRCVRRRQHQQPDRCMPGSGWPGCRSSSRVEGGPELRAAVAEVAARLARAVPD